MKLVGLVLMLSLLLPGLAWGDTGDYVLEGYDATLADLTVTTVTGDGSGLTGITATADPAGSDMWLQYNFGGVTGAEADAYYNYTTNTIYADNFVGDGSGLTSVTAGAPGNDKEIPYNVGGVLTAEAGFEYNYTTDTQTVGALVVTTGAIAANGDSITSDGALTIAATTSEQVGTSPNIKLTEGTTVAMTLGDDAGDDFLVDGTTFVVEGDQPRVGIGTATPTAAFNILSDEAGASGSVMIFERNSDADAAVTIKAGGDTKNSKIFFGDQTSDTVGAVDYDHNVDYLRLRTAGTTHINIDSIGKFFIGSTTLDNADIDGPGLNIDQAGNDDQIFALKSSDVSHGYTGTVQADTFGYMEKSANNGGGLSIGGISDSDDTTFKRGVLFAGFVSVDLDTDKTAANAKGAIELNAFQVSDGAVANVVADGNLVVMKGRVGGSTQARWILDEDGDTTQFGDITSADFPAMGTDPDVDRAGETGRDTDDHCDRGFDGVNQYVKSKKIKNIAFTITEPNDLDEADAQPVWSNYTGFAFEIERIVSFSNADNTAYTLLDCPASDLTDCTTIAAIDITEDGTGVYTKNTASPSHTTIDDGYKVVFDADPSDTPNYIETVLIGYFKPE